MRRFARNIMFLRSLCLAVAAWVWAWARVLEVPLLRQTLSVPTHRRTPSAEPHHSQLSAPLRFLEVVAPSAAPLPLPSAGVPVASEELPQHPLEEEPAHRRSEALHSLTPLPRLSAAVRPRLAEVGPVCLRLLQQVVLHLLAQRVAVRPLVLLLEAQCSEDRWPVEV